MKIDKEFSDSIKTVEWFCNCGNEVNIITCFDIKYVTSWNEAKNFYNKPQWEDKTLEAQNELTSFLFSNYRNKYQNWNSITKEAKKIIAVQIDPVLLKVKEKNFLDQVFIDCVRWDILNAIMENEYRKCTGRPKFFLSLFEIYKAGNFPCGWDNSSRKGKLIVF